MVGGQEESSAQGWHLSVVMVAKDAQARISRKPLIVILLPWHSVETVKVLCWNKRIRQNVLPGPLAVGVAARLDAEKNKSRTGHHHDEEEADGEAWCGTRETTGPIVLLSVVSVRTSPPGLISPGVAEHSTNETSTTAACTPKGLKTMFISPTVTASMTKLRRKQSFTRRHGSSPCVK